LVKLHEFFSHQTSEERVKFDKGHYMPKLNPALFEPLTRIENACRRVSEIMLTAPHLAPKDNELVRREIQEIKEVLEAFKAAVEAGEMTGFKDGGLRSARELGKQFDALRSCGRFGLCDYVGACAVDDCL
jgi:hypothetical protein